MDLLYSTVQTIGTGCNENLSQKWDIVPISDPWVLQLHQASSELELQYKKVLLVAHLLRVQSSINAGH